jgi:hypothetical protein
MFRIIDYIDQATSLQCFSPNSMIDGIFIRCSNHQVCTFQIAILVRAFDKGNNA